MDDAHKYTDGQIRILKQRLAAEYKQAERELKRKANNFLAQFKQEDKAKKKMVKAGTLSQAEYIQWRSNKILYSDLMKQKVDQMAQYMVSVDKQAVNVINKALPGVYAKNYNFATYQVEKGFHIDTSFTLFSQETVERLARDNPQLLPKKKLNTAKDKAWSKRKINTAITQGILQGEAIPDIAKRMEKVVGMAEGSSVRNARTSMTSAQNAGRIDSMKNAKSMGINLKKQWMATLDERTRASHREIDGEIRDVDEPFSNGLMFPADAELPANVKVDGKNVHPTPAEVYNCRCTLVVDLEDYPDEKFQRLDNINGVPIDYVTYKEWEAAKQAQSVIDKASQIDYSKYGGKEVYDILSKYDDVDDFLINSSWFETTKVTNAFSSSSSDIATAIKEIKESKTALAEAQAKLKAAQEAKKAAQEAAKAKKIIKDAENKAKQLEVEINAKGANKVFSDIWKEDVTYADYEAKKASIAAKKKYFDEEIDKLEDILAKNNALEPWQVSNLNKFKKLKQDLEEFEKYGEEYSKLLKEYEEVQKILAQERAKGVLSQSAYDQARKDAAKWYTMSEYYEGDKWYDAWSRPIHAKATAAEHRAYYAYTNASGGFNRPLAGFKSPQGSGGYGWSQQYYVGPGKVDLNNEGKGRHINNLTKFIEKSKTPEDIWVQTAQNTETLEGKQGFLGIDYGTLSKMTDEELKQFIGKTSEFPQFISASISRGGGSYTPGNMRINIFLPKGSEALYVLEDGAFRKSEREIILQRGGTYRITRMYWGKDVERGGRKLMVDMELLQDMGYHKFK